MWIASMLAAINSIVAQVVTGYHRIILYYNGISLTMTFRLLVLKDIKQILFSLDYIILASCILLHS